MPDAGRAQHREVDALTVVVEINGLDDALALRVAAQSEIQLLFPFRPGHHQLLAFTLQQADEQVLRRKTERVRRRIVRGTKDQVIANEARHYGVFDRAEKTDPFHLLRGLDLHNRVLSEGERG